MQKHANHLSVHIQFITCIAYTALHMQKIEMKTDYMNLTFSNLFKGYKCFECQEIVLLLVLLFACYCSSV
jgi:hypothetical protein